MSLPAPWSSIEQWIRLSTRVFVKKLSRNDTSWANDTSKHQSGAYIPRPVQDAKFFPELESLDPAKPHIFRARFATYWPQVDELKESSLSHYSNKGSEAHLTRVPRSPFRGLTPASWLVGGHMIEPVEGAHYWFMVVDSASDTAELLETGLDLDADFEIGLFLPSDLAAGLSLEEAELMRLILELRDALQSGGLEAFLRKARIPDSETIALEAQRHYLSASRATSFDPFAMERPGDAIMSISRDIEYRIYKRYELRRRAAEIVQALLKYPTDLAEMAVRGFPDLYWTFLSTSQQRKTRAGRSFERHVGQMLLDGGVRFEEQVVTGGRRPDFVLPSLRELREPTPEALVLSCKTTLKERWKQVTKERFDAPVFLATVDDRVASSTIRDMESYGIMLVVPESLKESKDTCYPGSANVISFRDMFRYEIRRSRPALIRLPALVLT